MFAVKAEVKVWNKEEILALLQKNPEAVRRGLLVIWNNQTGDEKVAEATKHLNGMGFNSFDAHYGSVLAQKIAKNSQLNERDLSIARKMCRRYIAQLVEAANYNERKKANVLQATTT